MISGRYSDLRNCSKGRIIEGGVLLSPIADPIGLAEHMGGNHGLNRIEPAVAAERDDHVAAFEAVIAQQLKPLGQIVVVGRDGAAVTPDVEKLQGMKGKRAGGSPGAGGPSFQA